MDYTHARGPSVGPFTALGKKRGWKKCVPEKSGVWPKTGNGIILGISNTKMGMDMKTKVDP